MKNNIFLIPHQNKYILYDPIKGIVSLLNTAAAKEIEKKIHMGEFDSDESNFLNEYNFFPNNNKPIKNLTFILTNDCTMRCIYCYAEGGKNSTTLSIQTIEGVLNDIVTRINKGYTGSLDISFHGGDISSCWNLFVKSVKTIRKILLDKTRYSISLGINGVLSNHQINWIVENTNSATVSCDGFASFHNKLRPLTNGNDSFSFTDNTIRKFDLLGYKYGLRSTITSESVHYLAEIANYFCENYKAKSIMFEPLFPMGRGSNLKAPDEQDFINNFRKANQIAKKNKRKLSYSGARLNTTTNIFCEALNNSCVINPQGEVSSCYEVISSDDAISNNFFYGHYDTIEKKLFFDNDKRERFIHDIKSGKEKCDTCFCKFHCAGDCPVKNIYSKSNSTVHFFDRCFVNKELTKDQLIDILNEN